MKRNVCWAVILCVAVVMVACRMNWAPVMRTNFGAETRVEATCQDHPADSAIVGKAISDAYQQGWRLAYASEYANGLLIFSKAYVLLCFEREASTPPAKVAPQRNAGSPPESARVPTPAFGETSSGATLAILSSPSDAVVWIDSTRAGRAPVMVNVAPGIHNVTVRWFDGREATATPDVSAAGVTTVRIAAPDVPGP